MSAQHLTPHLVHLCPAHAQDARRREQEQEQRRQQEQLRREQDAARTAQAATAAPSAEGAPGATAAAAAATGDASAQPAAAGEGAAEAAGPSAAAAAAAPGAAGEAAARAAGTSGDRADGAGPSGEGGADAAGEAPAAAGAEAGPSAQGAGGGAGGGGGPPSDEMDLASLIATFPPDVREDVLLTSVGVQGGVWLEGVPLSREGAGVVARSRPLLSEPAFLRKIVWGWKRHRMWAWGSRRQGHAHAATCIHLFTNSSTQQCISECTCSKHTVTIQLTCEGLRCIITSHDTSKEHPHAR